jgi:very-short-patch-repair endonuclease
MTKRPIVTQHIFHPIRKWRFDFAFPQIKLAIEIQGYGRGHADYMSMANDYLKHNEAIRLDWAILYFMSHDIQDKAIGKTIEYIIETIDARTTGTAIYTPRPTSVTAAEIFRKLHEGLKNK